MKTKFQMQLIIKTGIRILTGMAFTAMLLMQTGCIKEGMSKCEYKARLYIVVEAENADFNDVSDGATVFLFNNDRTYLSSIEVSAEDIAGNVPIPVSYSRDNPPLAVVWGNLGDGEDISPPVAGNSIESMLIAMKKSTDGYAVEPDNLFFGIKQLAGDPVEYIVISPKTGRLFITVKGLPEGGQSDRYYFTVDSPYDRYDFTGTSLSGEAVLKLPGMFQGKDLVTPEAYDMFHFPLSGEESKSLTVKLYEKGTGTGGDQLLATADKDTGGQAIVIRREQTTNVLINFTGPGKVEIIVVITNWGEIHQWDDW